MVISRVIEDAIEDDTGDLIIDYGPGSGFPKKIDVDFLLNAVDDEITYTISGFISLQLACGLTQIPPSG